MLSVEVTLMYSAAVENAALEMWELKIWQSLNG